MTSFVHLDYSNQHSGVTRVESAINTAQQIKRDFSGTRTLATLLLSAIAAAAMVVAYQVMDSVAEGHLLVVWIALWAVAFAALALFAGATRRLAARTVSGLNDWSQAIAQGRADMRLWEAARADPRVMADLQAAITRQKAAAETVAVVSALPASAQKPEPSGLWDLGRVLRAYPSYRF